jgi:Mg2+-importing ATPase
MGASSNFGNMFSVLGASLWLPYLPMAPIKILTNNLLYDFSQVPIPTDEVDPEQVTKPRPWSMGEIARFILPDWTLQFSVRLHDVRNDVVRFQVQ